MKLNNIFLYIAIANFLAALLLGLLQTSYLDKFASFLFFVNFAINMNLATKKSKGELWETCYIFWMVV